MERFEWKQQLLNYLLLYACIESFAKNNQNNNSTNNDTSSSNNNKRQVATGRARETSHTHIETEMGSCLGHCMVKDTFKRIVSLDCIRHQTNDEQEMELISNADERCRHRGLIYRIITYKSNRKRSIFIDRFLERQDLNYAKLTASIGNDSLSDIQMQNLDVNNLLHYSAFAKESMMHGPGTQTAVNSSRASSSLDLEWEHEYSQLRHCAHHHQKLEEELRVQHDARSTAPPPIAPCPREQRRHGSTKSLPHRTDAQPQLNSLASLLSLVTTTAPTPPKTTATHMEQAERDPLRTVQRHGTCPRQAVIRHGSGTCTRTPSTQNSWSHISTPESMEWDIDEEQQQQLRVEDDNLDHETLHLLHQIDALKNRVLNETGEGLDEAMGDGDEEGKAEGGHGGGDFLQRQNSLVAGRGGGKRRVVS